MLLTRRLERMGMRPLGFVAGEYALSVWGLRDMSRLDLGRLFAPDLLGDDLEEWLLELIMLKRQFRYCAIIGGLIETRFPGKEKTGRQITFSSDLIYDVLKAHEPDHILMQAARHDALTGLLDLQRLSDLLHRVRGRLIARHLDRVAARRAGASGDRQGADLRRGRRRPAGRGGGRNFDRGGDAPCLRPLESKVCASRALR